LRIARPTSSQPGATGGIRRPASLGRNGAIESGKLELMLETCDVPFMIRDVVTTIEPLAQKNADRLEVRCPNDIGTTHADLTKVRQSLFNLLSNACKFTEGAQSAWKWLARRRTAARSSFASPTRASA
jgi:K+-sensing histidine kinase KdpD